jgi:hypothetical protein
MIQTEPHEFTEIEHMSDRVATVTGRIEEHKKLRASLTRLKEVLYGH